MDEETAVMTSAKGGTVSCKYIFWHWVFKVCHLHVNRESILFGEDMWIQQILWYI
jgi:hypothetical protein